MPAPASNALASSTPSAECSTSALLGIVSLLLAQINIQATGADACYSIFDTQLLVTIIFNSPLIRVLTAMAYASRPTSIFPPGPSTASLRQTNSAISQQQSSALAARIASKKAELDNLIQLRDMSNDLAGQMEALQAKLETLKDGTEGELLRCRHVV